MKETTPSASRLLAAAAVCLWQAGCSGASDATSVAAESGVINDESYCSVSGLQPSTRQTFILLDQRALARATTVDEFVTQNAHVRDAVLAFGDPKRATDSGFSDWRERISLLIIPSNGNAPQLVFSGCVPSLSVPERTAAMKTDSAVSEFFRGSIDRKLDDEQSKFRGYLNGALLRAAAGGPEKAGGESGALPESLIVRSLRASGRLINSNNGVPRVVLLSNLAGIDLEGISSASDARRTGFNDGAKGGLDLGRSELHVFLVNGGNSDLAREYVGAYFLAQNAHLVSWSDLPSVLPPAPRTVARYTGTVDYVTADVPIQVRIAVDRNGELEDSWLVLQADPVKSTPLTGTYSCDSDGRCIGHADNGGFAQAWSAKIGVGKADFDAMLPFGGARNWEFQIQGNRLKGRVYDTILKYPPPHSELGFSATAATGATF